MTILDFSSISSYMCLCRAVFVIGWLVGAALFQTNRAVYAAPSSLESGLAALEVAADNDSSGARSATDEVRVTLASVSLTPPPASEMEGSRHFVTADGCYVLAGDLFGNGHPYALVELRDGGADGEHPGTALAEWRDEHWELRGLWTFPVVWRPACWENSADDSLPVTPATQPFWLERLDDDPAPWVVVASDVVKYHQEYYALRFDAETDHLRLMDVSFAKPEFLPGGWLRLYFNSGHRSEWEEWDYLRWNGQGLIQRADWLDGTPYNHPDDFYEEATVYDPQGQSPQVFRIEIVDGAPMFYHVFREGISFATVNFVRRHPLAMPPSDDASEEAYLFEKLTGLPRWLYPPSEIEGKPVLLTRPIPRLERLMRAQVHGSPAAVRQLATPLGRGGF